MKLFMFTYNTALILIYGVVLYMLLSVYADNKKRIYLLGAIVFIGYILDAFTIFLAEFLVYEGANSNLGFAELITYLPLKIIITLVINFAYALVFDEMLQLKMKWYVILALALPMPAVSLAVSFLQASAKTIWIFYSVRQVWMLLMCAAYFVILGKHKEADFYGRRFKRFIEAYAAFLVLIIAEDSFVIPRAQYFQQVLPYINERNISEDIMTVVLIVMIFRMVLQEKRKHMQIVAEGSNPAEALPDGNEKEHSFAVRYGLTAREAEVLHLLLKGSSNQEIAEALFISIGTVKWHVHQIYGKTGCGRRGQLVAKYNE